jgi:hypothetical protein
MYLSEDSLSKNFTKIKLFLKLYKLYPNSFIHLIRNFKMRNPQQNKPTKSVFDFMKNYDKTLGIMESIGDQTAKEQKSLLESKDDSIFEMGDLLGVNISSNAEDMQPRMYNTPVEQLTDGDKSIIVDEFVNMLKNIHEEVIDFSDIGPVATVIQNKFGFKQNLEDFLTELVSTAVDRQDTQAFAHANTVPGMKGQNLDPVAEEGGPADVAPNTVGVEQAVEPMSDVSVDVNIVPEIGAEVGTELPEMIDEPVIDDVAEPIAELPEMMDEPVVEEPAVEDVAEVVPEVPATEDVLPVEEIGEEVKEDETVETEVEETEEKEEVEETEEVEEEKEEEKKEEAVVESEEMVEEPSDEAQLESIKSEFMSKKKSTQVESVKKSPSETTDIKSSVDAQLEAIAEEYKKEVTKEEPCEKTEVVVECEDKKDSEDKKEDEIKAKLESIATNFHKIEKAKLESIEKDNKIKATLESIAGKYHAGEKAKVESIEKEKKLDAKLESLATQYKNSTVKPLTESNVDQRKAVKEKIENLSK